MLDVLFRRRFTVLAIFVGCLVGALGASFLLPPRYRAGATLVVDRSGGIRGLLPDLGGLSTQTYLDTLAEVARSQTVAEAAGRRLGYTGREFEERVSALRRDLRVTRLRGMDVLRVEVTDANPREAARKAQAVTEAFLSFVLDGRRAQARATRQFIEAQLAHVSRQLRQAEEALLRFELAHEQVDLAQETRLALEKLAEVEAQLVAVRVEREAVEARQQRAAQELRRRSQVVPSTWVTNPLVQSVRQQLADLEIQLAGLLEKFTEQHPDVVATQARILEARRRLEEELRRGLQVQTYAVDPVYRELVQQSVEAGVTAATLAAREGALRRAMEQLARKLRHLPERQLALARLTRQQKLSENLYLMLSNKYHEAQIAEASVILDLRVVDPALPPKSPVFPRPEAAGAVGVVAGLVAGVAAAFVVERLDDRFHRAEEAEEALGLPLLGMVPRVRATDGRIPMAEGSGRSVFAESFRTVRTALLYSGPEGSTRTVVVSSPRLRDGKSTVAANLALALARSGRRVVLVEANFRGPCLQAVMAPPRPRGLSDYLVGECGPDDVVQPSRYAGLNVVTAGTAGPNPAELLGSERMFTFLRYLQERFDVVIVDSPAALPVADAFILGRMADGVVLVVNERTTRREEARQAVRRLQSAGVRLLGLVFNGVAVDSRQHYYSYAGNDAPWTGNNGRGG